MEETITVDAPVETQVEGTQAVDNPVVDTTTAAEDTTATTAATAEGEQPVEETPDPFEDLQPDGVDGGRYFCTKTKWNRLTTADKTMRAFEEVMPGLTVESVKENFTRAISAQNLLDDWHSTDPATIDRAANFMFEKAPPETIGRVAEHVMNLLPERAPQVFDQIQTQMRDGLIEQWYQAAIQANDGNLFKAVQNIELLSTGQFRTPEQFQQPDPQRQQFETMQQKLARYEAQEQAMRDRTYQSLAQQVDNAAEAAKSSEIEKMIPKEVVDAYQGKPDLGHLTLLLKSEVDRELNGNPIWRAQLAREIKIAKTNPSEQTRAKVEATIRTFTAQVLARRAKPIIDKFAATAVANNAKVHQAQAKLQARREPTGLAGTSSPNDNWLETAKGKMTLEEAAAKWAGQ